MTGELSRLEKLYYRLEAQQVCLAWAFAQIADKPGVVFELGLGHGRTFDHIRKHLPGREIFVFDREVDAYLDCRPDPAQLILGDIADTLPEAKARFGGRVILAHSDVGSYPAEHNARIAQVVSANLAPVLADGALILSDLPLTITNTTRLPVPSGAREDRYNIYRFGRG